MAKKIIDLGARFKNAFGYAAPNQSNNLKKVDYKKKTGLEDMQVYTAGNGSFEEITLKGNGYQLKFANMINASDDALLNDVFAPPPMISFSRDKTITATNIDDSDEEPNNDAEVVERYNSGKWEIDIQGLLVDMINHQFPKTQLTLLRQVFDVNAIMEVQGDWFDALNIKSIYIKSFSPAGVQGFEDTIQFSLKACSIKPVEFFLKKK
jgi:hypothetical protein